MASKACSICRVRATNDGSMKLTVTFKLGTNLRHVAQVSGFRTESRSPNRLFHLKFSGLGLSGQRKRISGASPLRDIAVLTALTGKAGILFI